MEKKQNKHPWNMWNKAYDQKLLILLVNFRDASMCLNIKSILSSFVKSPWVSQIRLPNFQK